MSNPPGVEERDEVREQRHVAVVVELAERDSQPEDPVRGDDRVSAERTELTDEALAARGRRRDDDVAPRERAHHDGELLKLGERAPADPAPDGFHRRGAEAVAREPFEVG